MNNLTVASKEAKLKAMIQQAQEDTLVPHPDAAWKTVLESKILRQAVSIMYNDLQERGDKFPCYVDSVLSLKNLCEYAKDNNPRELAAFLLKSSVSGSLTHKGLNTIEAFMDCRQTKNRLRATYGEKQQFLFICTVCVSAHERIPIVEVKTASPLYEVRGWNNDAFVQLLKELDIQMDDSLTFGEQVLYQIRDYIQARQPTKVETFMTKIAQRLRTCSHCNNRYPNMPKCSGCKLVYYCGEECQLHHWKQKHKVECTRAFLEVKEDSE